MGSVTTNYTIGYVLGEGAFGSVRVGTHNATKVKRAIKAIRRERDTPELQEKEFLNEVGLLMQMDHPHIVRLHEYYTDAKHFHLVTDLYTGGELFEYIIR
jgi:calcium-dependent protein kinase